jgi:hypothetical protein
VRATSEFQVFRSLDATPFFSCGETIFFCEDEGTKAALIEAGASERSIYTRNELRILCEQNRIKPFTQAELRKRQEIKRTLGARIAK